MGTTLNQCIIIGGGGHARVVIDAMKRSGKIVPRGILDNDPALRGEVVLGVHVLGDDSLLESFRDTMSLIVAIGSLPDMTVRANKFKDLHARGFSFSTIIHPNAIVSPHASIDYGTVVLAGAIINPGACIGRNVIINSGAIIEHDCIIADHVHVAPGACLCGGITVGAAAHIGAGSVVRENLSIGEEALVGAGAAVTDSVSPCTVVVGVPAHPIDRK
jgi:UDP-perosamine 4-acetyltransferase